ncbi:helix-turn-helix domain-containing protein [Kitasatospora cathayae]|uniref:Helix-turn-helix transcriptional regulator n=1 Tax=Kitasatospora cathayae TaxID=3004092 RepID=A0ABY7QGM9_9ACTN|nr:helix-turn-helix transcriptional regulator [Kitasatospora sp. HUAS 3-15]WBP91296.1 helix-turn-helix transcriptional regulator [Kitasatospora sp. HUAS 3-15]
MVLSTLETLRLTVAAIRQRTGESQHELAAAVGLTQDKVSRRQSGTQPWSLDEVDTLARHWGMGPLDLLAGPTHAAQCLSWPPGTAALQPQPQPQPEVRGESR